MLNHRAKFFPERLVAVIDAIQVSTCPGHALYHPTRLFDVLFAHLVQRKLRRVEGHSVSTVDRSGCPECDQSFVTGREFGVAHHPVQGGPVLLQHWFRHTPHEVRNETEILLDLFENLLPSHRTPPFSRFPGGLSLDSPMVDPSEAQHMGQMDHFCLLDEMLVPRIREYAASIFLYSPSCREGEFSEGGLPVANHSRKLGGIKRAGALVAPRLSSH